MIQVQINIAVDAPKGTIDLTVDVLEAANANDLERYLAAAYHQTVKEGLDDAKAVLQSLGKASISDDKPSEKKEGAE